MEIGVNAAVAMIFQAFMGYDSSQRFKAQDMARFQENKLINDIQSRSGGTRAEAEKMAIVLKTLPNAAGQAESRMVQFAKEIPQSFKTIPVKEQLAISEKVAIRVLKGESLDVAIRAETTSLTPNPKPFEQKGQVQPFVGEKVEKKVTKKVETPKPFSHESVQNNLTLEVRTLKDKAATKYKEIVDAVLQNKPAVKKTQVATLLRNIPEFKANPILTVNEKGNLVFVGKITQFEILSKALGLFSPEPFSPGQKIEIKVDDFLKADKEKVNIRVMSGDNVLASKGSTTIGKFEKTDVRLTGKPFKLFEKTQEFIKKYAGLFGENYNPRGTSGVFYKPSTNIFISGRNDISTVAHEVTHFVDHQMGISTKVLSKSKRNDEVREDLTDVYVSFYPGGKKTDKLKTRIVEGLATFLQKYMENPTEMRVLYPALMNEFLKPTGQYYHEVFPEMIKDLRSIVDEYQNLNALSKVGALVQSGKTIYEPDTFLNIGEKVYIQLFDDVYIFEKIAERSGKAMTSEDISLWIRIYKNHGLMAFNNILGKNGYYTMDETGAFNKVDDSNWKTLVDDLSKAKLTEDFGHYLVARDTYFNYRELAKLRLEAEQAEIDYKKDPTDPKLKKEYEIFTKVYNDLKQVLEKTGITDQEATLAYQENKAKFKIYEEKFDKLTRYDLDFLHNPKVQLIGHMAYEKYKSKEGYAPLQREIYNELLGELQPSSKAFGSGKSKIGATIQRKGSSKAILNPLFGAMRNHAEIMRKGMQQIVYNELVKNTDDYSEFLQKIPLETVMIKNGQRYYPQEKDPHIVMARVNYKRTPILMKDEIIKSVIDNIFTYDNGGLILQVWHSFARIFTKGTTAAHAPFAIVNYILDQISATAHTMNNYIPIYDSLKEISRVVARRDSDEARYFAEWMFLGGERQTIVTWQDKSPEEVFNIINGESRGIIKVLNVLEKGVSIVSIPTKYSEILTRATEYIKARKAGKHQVVALEQAGQVSLPFHHIGKLGGKYGQHFIRSIPFANPSFQALAMMLKKLSKKNTAGRYLFVVAALTAAMIADYFYIVTKSSESQKNQYRDLDPNLLVKYIFIPKPGGEGFVRIRIPDQLSIPGAVINMIIADKMLNTNYTAGEYLTTTTAFLPEQINPTEGTRLFMSNIPQIAKPAIQVVLGRKDFPTVSDIDPLSLQNLPAGLRYTEQTSKLAKWLGEKTNISPMKIDFLITGYVGRATGVLTVKPGAYNPLKGLDQQYYFQTGRAMQQYYDIRQDILEGKTAFKQFDKIVEVDSFKINRAETQIKIIDNLMKQYREIDLKEEPELAKNLRNDILDITEEMLIDWNN